MNISYENQGALTFLTCALDPEEVLDSTSVGMITNNRIPGLIETVFTQMDSSRFIKYNVSAKVTVRQVFMGPVNRKRVLGVLTGIVSAFLSADEYMIDPRMLLLDAQYIFSDVTTGETGLLCVPICDADRPAPDIAGFVRNLIFSARFDQSENSDYVAKIISYLNGASSAFSLERFKDVLREINSMGPKEQSAPIWAGRQSVAPAPAYAPQATGMPVYTPPAPEPPKPVAQRGESFRPVLQADAVPPQAVTPERRRNEGQHGPDMGFAVPSSGEGRDEHPRMGDAAPEGTPQEEISLFYLLQHYNKENAQAYKARKERKKGAASVPVPEKKEKKGKKDRKGKKDKKEIKDRMPAFQVPGRENIPTSAEQEVRQVQPAAGAPYGAVPASVSAPSPAPVVGYGGQAGRYAGFGETICIGPDQDGDQSTVIMGMEGTGRQIMPFLLRKSNNERVLLNKPYFRIGRDPEYNDYAVIDNKYVGHSHCHIVIRDGEYFIVDDNSKNHTYVNGEAIPSGQEVKLAHGFIVTVANEQFDFKLY